MSNIIRLSIELESLEIRKILQWFEGLNSPPVSSQIAWWQCQTVIQEWIMNLAKYNQPNSSRIDLQARRLENAIEIWIWDDSEYFDLDLALEKLPSLDQNKDFGKRGLKIIEKVSDHFNYEPQENSRNCFYIAKEC